MQASIGSLTAIVLCIAGTQPVQTQPAGVVNSFETAEQVAQMQAHGSAIRPIEARAAHGIQALEVTFQPIEWPQVRMAASGSWDWSPWEGLAIDITNPQDRPVTFGIRVDDDAQADGIRHCRSATAMIEPGATSTFVLNHPLFVGCHWFQYVDQPLTGRSYDGENYNVGFVTVADEPYPELVEAARTVHGEAYARRWANAARGR